MGIRLSLWPVFAYEARRASRTWHMFAQRALLGIALLAATSLIWHIKSGQAAEARFYAENLGLQPAALSLKLTSEIAQAIFHVMVVIQLAFVFLIAPPTVAGTLCQDWLTGTLADMLASGLTAWEIVVGRLAARLLTVLSTIACIIPIACALMLLGGIEIKTVLGVAMVTTGVAILAGTLALALSVGRGRTHEVTLVCYAILGFVFSLDPLAVWIGNLFGWITPAPPTGTPRWASSTADITGLEILNPLWLALAPYYQPGRARLEQPSLFLAGCTLIGFLLTSFGIGRLRRSCAAGADSLKNNRQPHQPVIAKKNNLGWKAPWREIMRPLLDRNPVLWLDLRSGAGRRRSLAIWAFYGAVTIVLMGLLIYQNARPGAWKNINVGLANSIQVSLGILLVSIPAAAGLGEDRANGTLAALLVTPLTSRSIIFGKWLGTYLSVPWLAIFPCLAVYLFSDVWANPAGIMLMFGLVLAYGAAVTGLGICLATAIPNVGRAVGTTVSIYVLSCAGIAILSNYSPDLLGVAFGPLVIIGSIVLMAAWGFNIMASFKGDRGNAIRLSIFVGAFIAAAILLPQIASACNAWESWASVRIGVAAFVALLIGGFSLMKRTARFGEDNALELGLFTLFCACWIPVLIGCVDGWEICMNGRGEISYASPWIAGDIMIYEARIGHPSAKHAPWILFWILSFASAGAFLLRAAQKSLDHHFERAQHL